MVVLFGSTVAVAISVRVDVGASAPRPISKEAAVVVDAACGEVDSASAEEVVFVASEVNLDGTGMLVDGRALVETTAALQTA
jgi:hypothetical protein